MLPARCARCSERPPVRHADDFAGAVIGLQASAVAEQTFAALGATTTRLPGADISDVDGYEQQLASIWGNHYELQADFVTANVNLWPRPLVIVAGADVFESLDTDQQDVLREATADAIPGALKASHDEDASGGEGLCRGHHVHHEIASRARHAALGTYTRVRVLGRGSRGQPSSSKPSRR